MSKANQLIIRVASGIVYTIKIVYDIQFISLYLCISNWKLNNVNLLKSTLLEDKTKREV